MKNNEWWKKIGKFAFLLSWGSLVISILILFLPFDYGLKSDIRTISFLSLTLVFIIVVPLSIIVFCGIRRKWIYGFKNGKIHPKNAELHYNHGMNNIRSIIMVYVISISLLWGFVISNPNIGDEFRLMEYKLEHNLSNADLSKDGSYYWVNESLQETRSEKDKLYTNLKEQGLIVTIVSWYAILVYYVSLVEDFRDILKNRKDNDKK